MNKLNYVVTSTTAKTTYIPFNSDARYAVVLKADEKATLAIPAAAKLFYVSSQASVHVGFNDFTPTVGNQFSKVNYVSDQVGVVIPEDATELTVVNGNQAQHIGIYFYDV